MAKASRLASRAALTMVVAALGVAAWANEKSAPLLEDARNRLRRRETPAAIQALAAAVAADPSDADAQILYQDMLRRGTPEKTLVEQYQKAAAGRPDDALAAYLAARLLKPDDAVHAFTALVQKFPASPWPHEGRAVALDALGRAKEAAPEYDAAVAAGPREPIFRVSQARSLERAGQWAQAAELWKLALGLRPSDRTLTIGYGEALRRAGLLDEAVAQFEAAAKRDATDPEPIHRIGLARHDAKRYDDALKSYDAAIALDKGYVDAYCAAVHAALSRALAAAATAKRDPHDAEFAPAIAYGTRAVQADAQSPAAHIALGVAEEAAAELYTTHSANALREYDAALALVPATSPERVRALVGRAYICLLDGQWDDAMSAADKAIDQDDHAVTAYLVGGRALDEKGQPDDAVRKYFAPGLRVAPNDAPLHHARGVAQWKSGKLNDARRDLEAATQADPRNGRWQLSLGELCYQTRDYKDAQTALIAAADLRPADPVTWRALGRTLTSLKLYEDAASAYEEVVKLVEGDAAPKPADPAAPAPPAPPTPPAQPPVPPPAQPPAPPAQPPAPAPAPAADPAVPEAKHATAEHLYLTLLYADRLNQRDKAKAHAKKWVEQGGTNPNLDSWVQSLLE